MKYTLIAFLCLFVVFQVGDAFAQFEIREGNCLNAVAGDLVSTKHTHKTRLPFATRSEKFDYFGDKKIYCIQALSQKEASKGSTISIKSGGIGHTFATFEIQSAKNHGYEYNIQIYARHF